ncbi:NRCAM [Mytilus coruscus]|uniref:NRCAM n=1 Tax=Mytilus coruscus TaxID=42192 RepID=A0A6J8EKC0_MYTCO|nr:NRCAM [Mytilus coruscus]
MKDKKISVELGYSLRIPCNAPHSTPTAKINWGLKDTKTGSVDAINFTSSLSTDFLGNLFIISVEENDYNRGTSYICKATNPITNQNVSSYGNVVQPSRSCDNFSSEPHWSIEGKPESITANDGDSVTFHCNATGLPMLDIDWFINGEKLKVSRHSAVKLGKIKIPYPNKAVISNVNMKDRMVLQCNVSNSYGYVFADFYLNVLHIVERYILVLSSVVGISVLLTVTFVCIFTHFRKHKMSKRGNYQFQQRNNSTDDVQANGFDFESRPVSLYTRIDESAMIPDYFEIVQMRRCTRNSDHSSDNSSEEDYCIPEYENPYTLIKAVSENHLYAIPKFNITEHTFSLSALNAAPRDNKEYTLQMLDIQWTEITSTIRRCTDWCEQYTGRNSMQLQHKKRNSDDPNRKSRVLDETDTIEGGTNFRNDRVFNRLFIEKFRSDVFLSTPRLDENSKEIIGQGSKNERKSS